MTESQYQELLIAMEQGESGLMVGIRDTTLPQLIQYGPHVAPTDALEVPATAIRKLTKTDAWIRVGDHEHHIPTTHIVRLTRATRVKLAETKLVT